MKFKNAVDNANELLAEKAALEARVKVLGVENLALREALDAAEAELSRLKSGKPKCSNRTVAEPRPAALPQRFVVKIPQRYVCEGYHNEAYLAPDAEGDCLEYDGVVEAIKAAGGWVEE